MTDEEVREGMRLECHCTEDLLSSRPRRASRLQGIFCGHWIETEMTMAVRESRNHESPVETRPSQNISPWSPKELRSPWKKWSQIRLPVTRSLGREPKEPVARRCPHAPKRRRTGLSST